MPRYRTRAGAVKSAKDDDQMVVVDERSREWFVLNDSGAVIWRLLRKGASVTELRAALAEEFPDAGKEQIDADVESFVALLLKRDLIAEHPDE